MIDISHRRHFASPEELVKVRRYQHITWHYITSFYEDLPQRNILDVGASEGWLRNFVRGNYFGIDISPLSDYILPGTIIETSELIPAKNFDLIIYEHVLEHVDSPLDDLYAVFDRLKVHGYLFIAVPHAASPWAWEEQSHLHLFNEINLSKMLIKAKLEMVEWVKVELRKDAVELWMVSKKS